jgi:Txe/YoeB family toxin of toxin-antitoxin system
VQIEYTSRAKKDFKKLFNTQYKNEVIEVLNVLKENPFYLFPPLEILNGYKNKYSRKINKQHRIVYEVNNNSVIILSCWCCGYCND